MPSDEPTTPRVELDGASEDVAAFRGAHLGL